jgi:hypothetical protein
MSKRFEEIRKEVRENIYKIKHTYLTELEASNDRGVMCGLMAEANQCFVNINNLIYNNGLTIIDRAKLMRYNRIAHDIRNRCYAKYKILQSNGDLKAIIENICIEYGRNEKQYFDRINIAYEAWYQSNKNNLDKMDFAQSFEIEY